MFSLSRPVQNVTWTVVAFADGSEWHHSFIFTHITHLSGTLNIIPVVVVVVLVEDVQTQFTLCSARREVHRVHPVRVVHRPFLEAIWRQYFPHERCYVNGIELLSSWPESTHALRFPSWGRQRTHVVTRRSMYWLIGLLNGYRTTGCCRGQGYGYG